MLICHIQRNIFILKRLGSVLTGGAVYNELLKLSGTVTGEVFRQLIYLKQSAQVNRPKSENRHTKLIFLHNYTKPHIG